MAKLTTHLNRFNVAMTQDLIQNFVQPLGRAVADKNGAEILRQLGKTTKYLVAMDVTGELLADTLRTISGRPDDRPGGSLLEFANDLKEGTVPWSVVQRRLIDNLLFAGTGGYFQVLKEAMIDPAGAASKVGRISSVVLGPTVGSIVEGAGRIADVVTADRDVNPKTGKSKADTAWSGLGRFAARRVPLGAGQMVAPMLFSDSQASNKRRALQGYTRAMRRKDYTDALQWRNWYKEREGKPLSPDAINKAEQEYGQ